MLGSVLQASGTEMVASPVQFFLILFKVTPVRLVPVVSGPGARQGQRALELQLRMCQQRRSESPVLQDGHAVRQGSGLGTSLCQRLMWGTPCGEVQDRSHPRANSQHLHNYMPQGRLARPAAKPSDSQVERRGPFLYGEDSTGAVMDTGSPQPSSGGIHRAAPGLQGLSATLPDRKRPHHTTPAAQAAHLVHGCEPPDILAEAITVEQRARS